MKLNNKIIKKIESTLKNFHEKYPKKYKTYMVTDEKTFQKNRYKKVSLTGIFVASSNDDNNLTIVPAKLRDRCGWAEQLEDKEDPKEPFSHVYLIGGNDYERTGDRDEIKIKRPETLNIF